MNHFESQFGEPSSVREIGEPGPLRALGQLSQHGDAADDCVTGRWSPVKTRVNRVDGRETHRFREIRKKISTSKIIIVHP